jgi:predicted amidohydrolase
MKIALIQLNASDDPLWSAESIPKLLDAASGADLAVFPECMPFYLQGKMAIGKERAEEILVRFSSKKIALIAGGYVRENEEVRNIALLVKSGSILGRYFKRKKWRGERFTPGDTSARFEWGKYSCIPLICADAGDNPSPFGTKLMAEALTLGAGKEVPIVIPSYGAGLMTPYWHEPLSLWAKGTGAPIAICGVAGKSANTYFEDGESRHYGGGGSAVFWPDGSVSRQSSKRGIYVVDTTRRSLEFRDL